MDEVVSDLDLENEEDRDYLTCVMRYITFKTVYMVIEVMSDEIEHIEDDEPITKDSLRQIFNEGLSWLSLATAIQLEEMKSE